ncbi:MAG: M20/M25/M40 family metallo-hydrolase [Phycisphaerales bacterium]|nr:M20/M25/M40 family metallo-hydrolase [Phycisphaerales bacterium]
MPKAKLLVVVCSLAMTAPLRAQPGFVDRLNEIPTPARLRSWHDLVASEPHIAGTEGDARQIARLAEAFGAMGYEVDIHEIWPLLAYPVSAEVEVLHPSIGPGGGLLPLQETALPADPYSASPDLTIGFNAYSGSGEATGEVVYANYGRKEDFEKLAELGIDCTGKIVLARYGGNYRGYKAKFAEAAGAAGLLIFLDPGDSGFVQGGVYPDGGWQTDRCIQRGSIVTLGYQGDPLTPFVEATEDAERLDVDEVALPRIPVQPIGWGAARQIIVRMVGEECPEAWRGGLPMSYPLTGGPDLRVRVNVQQDRRIVKTANVIARLEGELYPDQWVIVGCHHDAWNCGAADPTSGLISLLESARSFAELAARGQRPARTVIFAGWAAEEFGIIGSSEWVEANYDELREKAVAYINLDMASMGPQFGASATPSVTRLVEECAGLVPQARAPEMTVFDDWLSRAARADDPTRPSVGNLGGGSDHVAFVCYAGVPSIALGGSGSDGSSYHTAYDNLHWYRQVVGEDYEPALMIARMTNAVAGRLASEAVLPLSPSANSAFIAGVAEAVVPSATEDPTLLAYVERLRAAASAVGEQEARMRRIYADAAPEVQANMLASLNEYLLLRQAVWTQEGQPDRPWFRSEIVAPEATSGYGSTSVPRLQAAVDRGDAAGITAALERFLFLLEGPSEWPRPPVGLEGWADPGHLGE